MSANRAIADTLLTALAPAVWGSTYVITTELLPPESPLWAAAIRALPSGIILLLLCCKLPRGVWWLKASILGVLNIGAFFYFLFVAAYLLPGGVAALVMSSQPMIVLLLCVVFLRQRVRMVQILACVVGVIGVALLALQPSAELNMVGVLAGLAGAVSMAAGVVLTKRWGRPEGVSILTYTGWQLTIGGIVLTIFALMIETMPVSLTMANWVGFVYLSVVGALFAYVIWFRGIDRLPVVTVSFLALVSPLAAAVLGFVILGESFTSIQMLGGVAITIAVVLVQPRKMPVVAVRQRSP